MKSLLIYSGGMDSATLLWKLYSDGYDVETITFDYGQRHRQEIEYAQKMIKFMKEDPDLGIDIRHDIVDVRPVFKYIDSSALTNPDIEVPECGYTDESAKITVVPNRNQILLSIAVGIAAARGIDSVMYAAHSGDHCLPGSTKIFTMRGIINIEDIIPFNDKVLSFNSNKKILEWKLVTDKIRKNIPKSIYKIATKSGSCIRCTSEHKIYTVGKYNWTKKFGWEKELVIKPAKDISIGTSLCMPYGVSQHEIDNIDNKIDLWTLLKNKDNLNLFSENLIRAGNGNYVNRYVDLENYIKLICWYITEGWKHNGNIDHPNRFGIYIAQSTTANIENVQEIIEAAIAWGFHPVIHGIGQHASIYFSGATTLVLSECGTNSYEKHLPWNWLLYNTDSLQLILNTLIKGDGYINKKKGYLVYTTTSKILRDQVIYIATKLGYRISVRNHINNPSCIYITMMKAEKKKKLNKFGMSSLTDITNINTISNSEPVYDISVEGNHNFFAGDIGWLLVSNSIYPDCRPEFLESLNETTRISTLWHPVRIEAPFIHLTKGDIVKIGLELGVPYEYTRSCYNAGQSCGVCPTCIERMEAFTINGMTDPIMYLPH